MLIPVRCFTCNKVIGHLWEDYQSKIQQAFQELNMEEKDRIIKFKVSKRDQMKDKTFEGKILDELGLNKYCCRSIMISTVDLTKKI
jgi:DNA-directed RNA polymerase subunit N (RpoN/RPB10)